VELPDIATTTTVQTVQLWDRIMTLERDQRLYYVLHRCTAGVDGRFTLKDVPVGGDDWSADAGDQLVPQTQTYQLLRGGKITRGNMNPSIVTLLVVGAAIACDTAAHFQQLHTSVEAEADC
jgi:hypothetical protein